jgi:Tol biopolymer transport system component
MQLRQLLTATALLALALVALSARRAQPETRLDPIIVSDTASASDGAQIVGDGVISTRDYEQNSSFSSDGRTIYFSKRTIWPTYASVLCESHLDGERWSVPTVLPFSGRDYDSDPFLAADGKRLYFASRRPVDGRVHRDRDIWFADRTATGWSAAQRLPEPVNSSADEAYPVIVRDGSLYFTSSPRDSTAQNVDTYRAQWLGDRFGTPAELKGDSDRVYGRLQAFVSPDESYMIFVSWHDDDTKTEAGIYSPGDLYVSERVNGAWTRGRHLPAPINSAAAERAPMVSADGRTLYFTSERGFATAHPERATTYDELERHLHESRNGLGDIYAVPLSMLGLGHAGSAEK